MMRKDGLIPSDDQEKGDENEENQSQRLEQKTNKQVLQIIRSLKANNNSKGEIICMEDLEIFF